MKMNNLAKHRRVWWREDTEKKIGFLMEIGRFNCNCTCDLTEALSDRYSNDTPNPNKNSKWLKFFPFQHRSLRFIDQPRTLFQTDATIGSVSARSNAKKKIQKALLRSQWWSIWWWTWQRTKFRDHKWNSQQQNR